MAVRLHPHGLEQADRSSRDQKHELGRWIRLEWLDDPGAELHAVCGLAGSKQMPAHASRLWIRLCASQHPSRSRTTIAGPMSLPMIAPSPWMASVSPARHDLAP